jgi:hypothetical protein
VAAGRGSDAACDHSSANVVHVVKAGDTCRIAARYGHGPAILAANPSIRNPNLIYIDAHRDTGPLNQPVLAPNPHAGQRLSHQHGRGTVGVATRWWRCGARLLPRRLR